jgi:hypothetical protein
LPTARKRLQDDKEKKTMTKKEKEEIVTLHFVPLTMTKKKEGDPETSSG